MKTLIYLLAICSFSYGLSFGRAKSEHGRCRFSRSYTRAQILTDSAKFEEDVWYWDGQFHKDGVAYRSSNGLTIDHTALGYATGLSSGRVAEFVESSPRNEAYHIMLLTHAIMGNRQAMTFVLSENPANATNLAASVLTAKLNKYLDFNDTFPGYGGLIPAFEHNVSAMRATENWEGKLSAQDSGQLLWAVYGLIQALDQQIRPDLRQLRETWVKWFLYAQTNARGIFLRGPLNGDMCAIATLKPGMYTYATGQRYRCEDQKCLNNDPFQGELMTWFLYFSSMVNQSEADTIWNRKRSHLLATNYTGSIVDSSKNANGPIDYSGSPIAGRHIRPITTQTGLYFSSNEQIKLLFLPYLDVTIVQRVYKNAERVRTCNSLLMQSPGMWAAVPNATSPSAGRATVNITLEYRHLENTGVPSAAVDQEQELDMVTPYSVFPTILFDRGIALAWYKNMLDGKQMQTVYGSLAASRRDGSAVARFVSWESKAPTLLALLGGIANIVRAGMESDGVYQEFTRVLRREYGGVFQSGDGRGITPVVGENLPLCLPNRPMPTSTLNDFSTCNQA